MRRSSPLKTGPLKIGLVGTGNIAGANPQAFADHGDQIQLTALCDINPRNLKRRSRETGVKATYTDLARMLSDADIDAVDICTTHDLHAEQTIRAARAGKHVIVEKPMACSMRQCRQMVAAAKKAGVTLMIAQMQRYSPSYRALKKAIDSGALGAIRAVRLDAMQNGPDGLPPGSWFLDGRRAGGGVVMTVSVHKIDLLRFLIGPVKRVTAVCRSIHPAFKNGAEDYAVAILEFRNGAIGELFATYSGFRMPWGESFMIFGDHGTAHAIPKPGDYGGGAFIASARFSPRIRQFGDMFTGFKALKPVRDGLPTDDPFVNQLLHFAACCRSGREPISGGADNIGTMAVIFGIYESARLGRPVELGRV